MAKTKDDCALGGAGGRNGICRNVTDCSREFHICDHFKDCHYACTKPGASSSSSKGGKHRRPRAH